MTDTRDQPRSDPDDTRVEAWLEHRETDPAAREQLALRFQPLAIYLAQRFAGRGENLDDLIQIANVGLLSAIDRFDSSKGARFSTFAAATMIGELKRHFRDRRWALRVPRRLQDVALAIRKLLPDLTQELGRSPRVHELATRIDASSEEVLDALEASQAYATTSLDAPVGQEGTAAIDNLGSEDPSIQVLDGWASVAPAIKQLSSRDRRVLYLRFFGGLTQSEIASEIGLSQMQISRILAQTIERLRTSVTTDDEQAV
jgi:RNA polymerase sigma-B factor